LQKQTLDVQLKKGLLESCVLRAIKYEESYGYKVIQDIVPYVELSESTLYPVLKRLESQSLVTARSVEHNGRLRRYYMMTTAGLAKLEEFKGDLKTIMKITDYICEEGGSRL